LASTATKLKKLRGQSLLFRCLVTGVSTTAPAHTRYLQGRGIDPCRRELVVQRPANWIKTVPPSNCEHYGMEGKGRGTSGYSGSTSKLRSAWHPERRQRDEQPPLDACALGGLCGFRWVEVLAHQDPIPKEPAGQPISHRTLQAATGANLE